MASQLLQYYKDKGELVELLSEYNFYHPKYPYSHYMYAVGKETLLIEVQGEAQRISYQQAEIAIENTIEKFMESRKKVYFIHNYENLYTVSFYIRKQYANWLLKNLGRFENIVFYKPSPLISFYIGTKKFFGKELDKVKSFNKIENLIRFFEMKDGKDVSKERYKNITKHNVLSLLNDKSLIKSDDWVYNVDNGRLKHEVLLFDDNIIIRNIEGAMIEKDVEIIEKTSYQIQKLIKPAGTPYISLIDLEKFSSISLKARRASGKLMDQLQDYNKAIVFFNTSTSVRLAIKLTSAIKSSIREKVFIAKDLEAALILALSLKGISVEKVKMRAVNSHSLWNAIDRLFNKKKIYRIQELEKEIERMKRQREGNIKHIFSMLSRISWDENFEPIHLEGVERDDSYMELYRAIELLHKDIEELSKNYKIDS